MVPDQEDNALIILLHSTTTEPGMLIMIKKTSKIQTFQKIPEVTTTWSCSNWKANKKKGVIWSGKMIHKKKVKKLIQAHIPLNVRKCLNPVGLKDKE